MNLELLKTAWAKPWVARSCFGFWVLCILFEFSLGLHRFFSLKYMNEVQAIPIPVASVPLDRSTILHVSLFGKYMPDDLTEADVRASMLKLTLVGIFFSSKDEKQSEVMIKLPDQDEQVYHVGDSLPGGAMIKQIQADEVFILHRGSLESLSLPDKQLNFDPPPSPLE